MLLFITAIVFTLGVSAFCSLLEAIILSTTTTEIESLKQLNLRKGEQLEKYKTDIEETSSAILGLNTVANTAGTAATTSIAAMQWGADSKISILFVPVFLVIGILVFSEVIPKNIGVIYRKKLQPGVVLPLAIVRGTMLPTTLLCKTLILWIAGKAKAEEVGGEEIILLAEKSAKEGNLTQGESNMISNTLSLDDVKVADVMTPRTVVTAYEQSLAVGELFAENANIPFARMPVYDDNIDNIVGLIRRRDLLKAKAEDQDSVTVQELMQPIIFIPENAHIANALQEFLKNHQQLAAVVDEFGSISGVVTVEDIVEHIIGQEIFEKDDVAIDMRELARRKKLNNGSKKMKIRRTSPVEKGLAG